jgi:8-oxo-dGTP pyrophosphatase MutT (NUDIX family)
MSTPLDPRPGAGRTTAFRNAFLAVEIDDATGHSLVRVTDAAALLIYVRDRDAVLLVAQHRPAAVRPEERSGRTREPVAGRFDYATDPRTLVVNEAREEAGVHVAPDEVRLLNHGRPLYTSPGVLTERVYLAYAEVESARVDPEERTYGAGDREAIDRVFVPAAELAAMPCDNLTLMALVQWFLANRRRGTEAPG